MKLACLQLCSVGVYLGGFCGEVVLQPQADTRAGDSYDGTKYAPVSSPWRLGMRNGCFQQSSHILIAELCCLSIIILLDRSMHSVGRFSHSQCRSCACIDILQSTRMPDTIFPHFPLPFFTWLQPQNFFLFETLVLTAALLLGWLRQVPASFTSTRKARLAVVCIRACRLRLRFRHPTTNCDIEPTNNLQCPITSGFIDFSCHA